MAMRTVLKSYLLIVAILCIGCRAQSSGAYAELSDPIEIREGGVFFDGGTVGLVFIGRDGAKVEVFLPCDYPAGQPFVGQPFFLNHHPALGGQQVEVGSKEERDIIAALKKVEGESETATRARKFLEAARIEDYLAAHPALLKQREELHQLVSTASQAYSTKMLTPDPDDATELRKLEHEIVEAKTARANAQGHWDEFNTIIKILAAE